MDDGGGVDFSDTHEDSLLELLKALHTDSFQEGASHFPEQGLNQIQPGAVFGGMNVEKAVWSGR
jgi:hypothetical protein